MSTFLPRSLVFPWPRRCRRPHRRKSTHATRISSSASPAAGSDGAIGAAAPATVLARRRRTPSGLLVAAAGLSLAIWAGLRTDVLGHAVLVTTLPGWLDRLSVTLGLGVGLAAVVVGHAGALRSPASRGGPEAERQPAATGG